MSHNGPVTQNSSSSAEPAVPIRRRPRRDDVRNDIRAAAREVFLEQGYAGASLEAIAKRAGFSKGAVYSNFAGKGDLFLDLAASLFTERSEMLTAAGQVPVQTTADLESAVHALSVTLLKSVRDGFRSNVLFAEFRAACDRDPELLAAYTALRTRLADSLADAVAQTATARGLKLTVPSHDVAVLVLAVINGLSLEHVGHENERVIEADTLTTVLMSLITPAQPRRR